MRKLALLAMMLPSTAFAQALTPQQIRDAIAPLDAQNIGATIDANTAGATGAVGALRATNYQLLAKVNLLLAYAAQLQQQHEADAKALADAKAADKSKQ